MSHPFEPQQSPERPPWSERTRLGAVTGWSGFLAAVLGMPVLLWAHHHGLHGFAELTASFGMLWMVTCVAAWLSLVLSKRPPVDTRPPPRQPAPGTQVERQGEQ